MNRKPFSLDIIEAGPYIARYRGKNIVIKYGGNAISPKSSSTAEASDSIMAFAEMVVSLSQVGMKIVVVHGGGPQLDKELLTRKIATSTVRGKRVTSAEVLNVAEQIFSGRVNKDLAAAITLAGKGDIFAFGLSGRDANLVVVEPVDVSLDLGFVGQPIAVNTNALRPLLDAGNIPVISPICADREGHPYNVNADDVASAIAIGLEAERLIFMTETPGVLDKNKNRIPVLRPADIDRLIEDGTISGGMIPKVENCRFAINNGVKGVVILGSKPENVPKEAFSNEGSGSLFLAEVNTSPSQPMKTLLPSGSRMNSSSRSPV